MFLSRDRVGICPLFYTSVGGTFLFASEAKALLQHPLVSRTIDPAAIDEVFTFWHTLTPRTMFQGIHELPSGHSAIHSHGTLTIRKYWDLCFSDVDTRVDEGEYADELEALLCDAVRIRLRSDVPVGSYLSGGLDSTVIAGLAKRHNSNLRTFSVRFEDELLDEGGFQSDAVRHLGTQHTDICCSYGDIARVFPEVIWHTEKPVLRSAPAPLFLLAKLVRDSGYKVALTGEGSDEVLGGYDIYKEAKVRAFCAAQPDSRMRPLLLKKIYPYMPQLQRQPAWNLNAFFQLKGANPGMPFFSHQPRWTLTSRLKSLFSADMKAAVGECDSMRTLESTVPSKFGAWDGFARAQYLESRYLLPGYILSSQGDRMSMAHGVETRFPFLDYRLVEFASKLPPHLKMKVLCEKYLLKSVARKFAPASVVDRSKQPYRAPDARSFMGAHSPEYVAELLSPSCIKKYGLFDSTSVQRLVAKALSGNLIGTADNMAVVGVLSTQLLVHHFIMGSHFQRV
jgi:asparagine synthase (glutamine-hydrolysing)